MLIGSKDLSKLERNLHNLSSYSVSLVPKYLRHNRAIINNQKYYVALAVRENKKLKFDKRMQLCQSLLSDVSITGTISAFYSIDEIFPYVDFNKLFYNLQEVF